MIKTITLILYLTSELHDAPVIQQIPMASFETCIEKGTSQIKQVVDTAPLDIPYVTAFACEVKVQRSI